MKRNAFTLPSPLWAIVMTVVMFVDSASAHRSHEQVLHRFQGTDGSNPWGNLIADEAGNFYGTAEYGGTSFYGTVFKLTPPARFDDPWTLTTLYSFSNTGDGARPTDGLIFDSKGNLYGTTTDNATTGYGEVFQLAPPTTEGGSWTETVLYHFQGLTDGANPVGSLISDADGNLYGTTDYTVFELSPPTQSGGAWTFTLLHEFKGGTKDGTSSHSGLVRDRSGNLYGTTLWGGYAGNKYCGSIGCGTAFEVSPPSEKGGAWSEQVIHFFGMGNDGFDPEGGLTLDRNGNLYGTTFSGGAHLSGTAFQLTPPSESRGAWSETVIHSFNYSRDGGAAPLATMIMDREGNLFGTTLFGGNPCIYNSTPYGCGVVFKLSRADERGADWHESVLYFFKNAPGAAAQPAGSLLFSHGGSLYGTTVYGGNETCPGDGSSGCGTVFRIVREKSHEGAPNPMQGSGFLF